MTKTQVETRIDYIAQKYKPQSVSAVNSIRHLYSDEQKQQIATAVGTLAGFF